jgi:hypothetical protein
MVRCGWSLGFGLGRCLFLQHERHLRFYDNMRGNGWAGYYHEIFNVIYLQLGRGLDIEWFWTTLLEANFFVFIIVYKEYYEMYSH